MDCIRIVTTERDFTMIEIVTEKKILDFLVNAKKNVDSFLKLVNTANQGQDQIIHTVVSKIDDKNNSEILEKVNM